MNTSSKNQAMQPAPMVRIGIIQSTRQVSFYCDSIYQVLNNTGEQLFTVNPGKVYRLAVSQGKPAKLNYQVRVDLFKNKTDAENKLATLLTQGLPARIREVGLEMTFRDNKIDNRDYWVTIGRFDTRKEAIDFRDKLHLPHETFIAEEIEKRAAGFLIFDEKKLSDCLRIVPENSASLIRVDEVPIGIEFHWQRKESLSYRGIIEVGLNNAGELVVTNEIDIENYLASVNSSEMTPDCPLGLLEAQTIAARSTVFATMGKHHYNTDFHLCSDDHCQCYQGALREQEISRVAMKNTYGETLFSGAEVCDARYSKICGGIMESYENVWDERIVPYLLAGIDGEQPIEYPADTEEKARRLIDSEPQVFCNTNLIKLPERLANLYSTQNLFRWEVVYDRRELEQLISQKLETDFGELIDLKPLARGASGRLIYMEVVGSKKTIRVGKELEIRRMLSKSHLYSSCFYVKKETDVDGNAVKFILKGAGWGHGVGLCQVGATVMALKGYDYKQILKHYYKNSQLIKLY